MIVEMSAKIHANESTAAIAAAEMTHHRRDRPPVAALYRSGMKVGTRNAPCVTATSAQHARTIPPPPLRESVLSRFTNSLGNFSISLGTTALIVIAAHATRQDLQE